ncbi:MAG: LysR family transcriptional regulator [Phycisphaeraceae bacterium]
MANLNFHHLHHFWAVAREGSIARASETLNVSPPTISTQIKALETALGEPLFHRRARRMDLTETGQCVFEYADDIFSLGNELVRSVQNGEISQKRNRIVIGVTESLPKLIAHSILRPAIDATNAPRVVCREGDLETLMLDLASFRLDLVLSEEPAPASSPLKVFSHKLGDSGISFYATAELAAQLKGEFPTNLDGAPILIPTERNVLRRTLDQWFTQLNIQPRIVAEFEDTALTKYFAADGTGILAIPSVVGEDSARLFGLELIGSTEQCRESFYIISPERKLTHSATLMLTDRARNNLFTNQSDDAIESLNNQHP